MKNLIFTKRFSRRHSPEKWAKKYNIVLFPVGEKREGTGNRFGIESESAPCSLLFVLSMLSHCGSLESGVWSPECPLPFARLFRESGVPFTLCPESPRKNLDENQPESFSKKV